jgi:hypothetical protein
MCEGRRVVVAVRDTTDDVVHNTFNTWFFLCCSSLDDVREAERLDNAIEENEVVYHTR